MTALAPYTTPTILDPSSDAVAVAMLTEIQTLDSIPEYSAECYEVDLAGDVLQDLSPLLVVTQNDSVHYDSTTEIQEDVRLTLNEEVDLRWGSAIVAVYQLIRSDEYNAAHSLDPATWLRFALGHYVVTTPGMDDMDSSDVRSVKGFGKNYLLQTASRDSFAFDFGDTYHDAIETIFIAAGLVASDLSEVVRFPGSWADPTKTLPAPRNYPVSDGKTYLAIVNELLKASGCRPLSVRSDGLWRIELIPKPISQTLRWTWAGSDGTDADVGLKAILRHTSKYVGDVYNAPNQWIFIQDGLDFEPGGDGMTDGSSGLYVVDNLTVQPSDQISVGRVISVTQSLQASGQDDLVAQADEIVADALRGTEQIGLTSAPWPAAGHYDVFTYAHRSLPNDPTRRLQAQSWTLPLWGSVMEWQTFVVAS